MTCKTPPNALCLLLLVLTVLTSSSLTALPDPPIIHHEDSLRLLRAIEKPRIIVPLTSHVPTNFSSAQVGMSLPLGKRWTVQPVLGLIYAKDSGTKFTKFSPEAFVRFYKNGVDHVTQKRIRHGVHLGAKCIRQSQWFRACEPYYSQFAGESELICDEPEFKKFIHKEWRYQLGYNAGISWDWDRFSIDVNTVVGLENKRSVPPKESGLYFERKTDFDYELSDNFNILAALEVAVGIPINR